MTQLARVLARLPVSCAATEELLLLLERAQPLAAQTLLQHSAAAAGAAGGVSIQSSRQRWLARVGPIQGPGSSCGSTSFQRGFAAANAVADPPAEGATSSSAAEATTSSSADSRSRWEDAAIAQWREQQRRQQQKAADALSPLEHSIQMCPNIQALAAVVNQQQDSLTPAALLRALNRLTRLVREHQQQQRLQQQEQEPAEAAAAAAAAAAAGADDEQQRQLVQQAARQLLQRLPQVQAALPPAKLLQVLHCMAQLGPDTIRASLSGDAGSSSGSSEAFCLLLAPLLQQLCGNVSGLQSRHLPLLAQSLALLNVTSLVGPSDSNGDDADLAPAAADHRTTAATDDAPAAAAAAAAEQAARQLLLELCAAVQAVPVAARPASAGAAAGFDVPGLAKLFSAMARLGHYDWQMMRHLSQIAIQQEQEPISPANLVSMLVGCAKLHHYDQQLCNMLAAAAEAALPAANGSQLAMITWALATLKIDHPGAFAAAARQGILRSGELQPRHLGSLAWAFTVRKASHPGLFDALAARALALGPAALEPQHLSLLAWSFAKQGQRVEGLMAAIGDQAAEVVGKMRPQNVSNLAWAFGALALPHDRLFAALAGAAKSVDLEGYGNQNITDLAWGCAATNYKDPELFDLVARATLNNMAALSPHSLSDLCFAFAALKHPAAPAVLEAAAPAAATALDRFSLGMLADLLWSFAFVGVRHDELLAAAAAVLPQRSLGMASDMRSAAKVLWALKSLQFRDEVMEAQLAEAMPGIQALLAAQ